MIVSVRYAPLYLTYFFVPFFTPFFKFFSNVYKKFTIAPIRVKKRAN